MINNNFNYVIDNIMPIPYNYYNLDIGFNNVYVPKFKKGNKIKGDSFWPPSFRSSCFPYSPYYSG